MNILRKKKIFTQNGAEQLNILQTALKSIDVGLSVIDKDKKIILSNKKFKSLFSNITSLTDDKELNQFFRLSLKELESSGKYATSIKYEKKILRITIYRIKPDIYAIAVKDLSIVESQQQFFHSVLDLYEYFLEKRPSTPEIMERVIDVLSNSSNFGRGVIRLFDEKRRTKYLSSFGVKNVKSADIPEEALNYFFQDKFRYGNFFYIPYSERKKDKFILSEFLIPSTKIENEFEGGWHPQDLFIAPLKRENKLIGILSFDDPLTGKLPSKQELQPLTVFVSMLTEFLDSIGKIKEIENTKYQFEMVFENLDEGIVVTDGDNDIIYSNSLGRKIWERPKLISFGEDEDSIRKEFTVDIDGENRNIFVYSKRINSFKLYVFIDNTERRMMDQLYQNTKRLAQLGELSAGVAHEINNPLQSIVGYSQLLQEVISNGKKEELVEYSNLILSSAMRAKSVVDFLASFGRELSTQEKIKYHISKPIKDAYNIISDLGDLGDIRLSYYLEGDFMVEGNPSQMTEAIINLLRNSVESIKRGHKGDKININAYTKKDKVIIDVEDNGAGIEDAEKGKIFDTFYTTKQGGTGLGLGIVRRIVTLHRGKIELVKNKNGALFRITLPALKEEDG